MVEAENEEEELNRNDIVEHLSGANKTFGIMVGFSEATVGKMAAFWIGEPERREVRNSFEGEATRVRHEERARNGRKNNAARTGNGSSRGRALPTR